MTSNTYRIKQGAEHIHNQIIQRVILKEEQSKNSILKTIIIDHRKEYRRKMAEYRDMLYDFIENHRYEIDLERAKLLLLTDPKQLKQIQNKEE